MEALRGLLEIFRLGGGYVHEGLRVAVHEGEPGALHVDHHAMTAAKGVAEVGNLELDLRQFSGRERLGFLEAVAELAAKHIAAHELLIAAHRDVGWVRLWVGEVAGVNINELDDPIRVRAGRGDVERGLERAGEGEVFLQGFGFIHEHVGT